MIVTADWHLREDLPVCRNDPDWMQVQADAMKFVVDFANKRGVPIAIVGDLFHRSHVHPSVVSMFLDVVQRAIGVYILAGQHDLPYHSLENITKSSFGNVWLLAQEEKTVLHPLGRLGRAFHFGELAKEPYDEETSPFAFVHQLCFESEKVKPPAQDGKIAEDMTDLFPKVKYICLGDNHRHFLWKKKDQKVINPGCLVRQSSDLIDYQPGFYYVDEVRHEVEFVPVPDQGDVSNAHIVKEKERDDRIEAFISTLEKGTEVSLDFVYNLRSRMGTLEAPVVEVLEEMLQEIVK